MFVTTWVCSLVEAMARSGRNPVWMDMEEAASRYSCTKSTGKAVLYQGLGGAIWLLWHVAVWEHCCGSRLGAVGRAERC